MPSARRLGLAGCVFARFRRQGKAFDDLDDLVAAEPVALYLKWVAP
jgi:hypothetical protein